MTISVRSTVVGFLLLAVPLLSHAAPGDFDGTFGAGGVVRLAVGTMTTIAGVARQADGKIVVAGASDGDFLLARFEQDGSVDTTFGTGGVVTTSIGDDAGARAVVVQPDGLIVAAGTSTSGGLTSFTLVRYDEDGVRDPAFGVGGIVTTTLTAAACHALVLQDDGRLVAAGTSDAGDGGEFTLIRYDEDGSIDASFGTGGIATTSFSGTGTADLVYALAIRADQKLVACGRKGSSYFAAARYDDTGALDPSFGSGGTVSLGIGATCRSIALQADGRMTAVGFPESGSYFTALVRLLDDGSLDPALQSNATPDVPYGMRFFGPPPLAWADAIRPYAVVVEPGGRIVMSGYAATGFYVTHAGVPSLYSLTKGFLRMGLYANGIPAPYVSSIAVADAASFGARGALLQPDTKTVSAGYESPNRIVVARFLSGTCGNGTPEPDEECDDGNATDGDGCDTNCTVTGCGNAIATAGEACDGGSGNDYDCCTDACTFVAASTACASDGNPCTDDVCNDAGACNTNNTLTCDDGLACTTDDVCGGGACGGTPVSCGTCEMCWEPSGECAAEIRNDCKTAHSSLQFRNSSKDSGDRMDYEMYVSDFDASSFGDPLTTDDYSFCMFDYSDFPPKVAFSARMPAAQMCGRKPCWSLSHGRYRYRGAKAELDGVRSVKLDPEGWPAVKISARGVLLNNRPGGMPAFPLTLPIRTQLRIGSDACWESPYNTVFQNDGGGYYGASN